jgi:putative hydrolase of the HAD superfamily
VIFDWGGTLTPWHEVDVPEQWRVFARQVHGIPVESSEMPP